MVVRVSPPPAPVTVTLVIPVAALLDADRVNVLLVPVVDDGLNVAVTPPGNPLALNATPDENPPLRVIVIALVPLLPLITGGLGGFAETVTCAASGGAGAWHDTALPPL